MTISKKILAAVFCVAVLGIGSHYIFRPEFQKNTSEINLPDKSFGWKFPIAKFPETGPGGSLAYSDIRDPGGIPQGLPVRLKIPVIGVDSAIEDALITPDGRMDVPVGSKNVAWFALGPHPGQSGSAVIGGHFGINNGVKFVFYDLDKLRVGDKIYIEDDKGDTLTFIVRKISLFGRDDNATTVFTSKDGLAHLNLITCEGIWNKVDDTYPERRVVFTDAITSEGAAPESAVQSQVTVAQTGAIFTRTLDTGSEGADVTALQTILEQKGFLVMPSGVPKGYFGNLTRLALGKYQASVGLPRVGVLGPLTRAKLTSELSKVVVKAALPRTALPITKPFFSSQIIESVKSLYATPKDALITFLFLTSIIFMVFKIVRRVH